jgi:carbon monoxide dehydrogenase subunit G
MKAITIERVVEAPPARVWAILTDLDGSAAVITAVERVERLDGGEEFGVGTRWRETRTLFGKEATETMEVTALEPGRSYVVESRGRGARYRSELGVEPDALGESRLWMTFGAVPEGPLGRLLAATIGRLFLGATRRMLRQDLDDIAKAAERRQRA